MVHNEYIKCEVCGTVTRVRLQVGWLEEHPINVTCGECGISLKGIAHISQFNVRLSLEFENAEKVTETEEPNEKYIVECSGEFPGKKQQEFNENTSLDFVLTPFIENQMRRGESYEQFVKRAGSLLQTCYNWKNIKRIF